MQIPRLRFGLRTLLVLTVLVAIPSAWLGKHWLRTRTQRPIVAKIRANGGHILYDYQYDQGWINSSKTPPGSEPLRKILGDDFFATVKAADYGQGSLTQLPDIEIEQLSELEQLNINVAAVPDSMIARLAALPKLESLNLSNCDVSRETFQKLTLCTGLKHLKLWAATATAEQLRELKHLDKLTSFDWESSSLDDERLLAMGELKNLQWLGLVCSNSKVQLTARGYASLAQLKKLQMFQMMGADDQAINALAKLQNLKSIQLWNDQLTDAGLLQMASFDQLVFLQIDSNSITDTGLAALRGLTRLESLHLASPNITDAGLANFTGLQKLKSLKLASGKITDDGLPFLLALTNLEELQLHEALLTDNGLQQLAPLKNLKSLEITQNDELTGNGVKRLRSHLPGCRFYDFQSKPGGGGSAGTSEFR